MTDLRLALRALAASPLATLVLIVSMALGIGANAAVFALVDSLLLRALPVPQPDRLALVEPSERGVFWTHPAWQAIAARRHDLFGDAAAWRSARFNLSPRGQTDVVERVPFTIVGVTPPRFTGLEVGRTFDVAVPVMTNRLIDPGNSFLDRRTSSSVRIVARLAPGRTLETAQEALRGVQPQIREETRAPEAGPVARRNHYAQPFVVRSGELGASFIRQSYRQPILVILGVVALVLLVACANLANVFLARAAARQREQSVRMALGATRWRLARAVIVEILLVSIAGALAGILAAQGASRLLVQQLSTQMGVVFLDVHVDWRLIAFTATIAILSTLFIGLAPALRAAGANPIDAMRSRGRGATADRRGGVASWLVVSQVALSLVLVAGAGLFLQTFRSLTTLDTGFDRDRVLVVSVDTQGTNVDPARRAELFERVLDAVRATPTVAHAALSNITPVSGMVTDFGVEIEGAPPPGEITLVTPGVLPLNAAYINSITPDWFATYGTRLVDGRDLSAADRAETPPVAIVNERFVQRLLPGVRPIGKRFRSAFSPPGTPNPWIEIVGVVRDATYVRLRDELASTFYVPMAQWTDRPGRDFPPAMRLSVRPTAGPPTALTRAVSAAIAQVDPAIGTTFMPLSQQVDDSLTRERLLAMLGGFFGLLALLLASLGLYGVLADAVGQRRREIGIRMALGARAEDVARMVTGRGLRPVLTGIAIGAGGALLLSRFVETLLFGVTARDPWTFVTAAVTLTTVGMAAAWLPARRAARTDPARVLQAE